MTYRMKRYYYDGVSSCGMCTPHLIWWALIVALQEAITNAA